MLRVLMVEDSTTDAKLVARELRRTHENVELERVETADAMREALENREWDLVISDWSMPSFNAPAALAILKQSGLDLPFIIVSGTVGEEAAVEAMRAGASDYVVKDKLGRLNAAVERELRERRERIARRVAEAALRISEGRFRRLADSGIIGISVAALDGGIVEANHAYLELVGYSQEELLERGIRWVDLTPPELMHLLERANQQLRASGVAAPWETELFHKDGRRTPVLVGMATLDHPKCIAVTLDLTERKREEAARRRAEDALHESEEQLRQAQKMEAVGRLAGGVAHDFNNVLSVILSYADFMLEDLDATSPLRGDLGEIHKAASRAANLTRQLLTFSRQHVAEAKVIDLGELLGGMHKMLERMLGEDVELVLVTATTSGRVRADPGHIEQVVMNLVVNARDAMPAGGKLTIEVTNVELDAEYAQGHLPTTAGPYVMMAFSDTGTGMDRVTQTRIFEPFFTTKPLGKGTGLGLSTVFGIVRQAGGNLWVYSEVGRGTCFKVYLPRVADQVDVVRRHVLPVTLHGRETILLVEDESQVRTIALNVLRRYGYHVLTAQTPHEALTLSEHHVGTIDLLLTDVVMPQMNGPELARRLCVTRPSMKVLCMSGYTDHSIVQHGVLEAGMAFLQKPLTPASLAGKLRQVLDSELESPG